MFDESYYESLLNGIESRTTTRIESGMDTEDALFRTLVDDGLVAELADSDVTRCIANHTHSRPDEAISRSFAMWLLELGFDGDSRQARFAGEAFNCVFADVQQRLYNGTDN